MKGNEMEQPKQGSSLSRPVLVGISFFTGVVVAAVLGVGIVFITINILIPWDEICAALSPAQQVVAAGSTVLTQLQDWLAQAESFVTVAESPEVDEARTGFDRILGAAGDLVDEAKDIVIDVVTAPLRALIALAQSLLSAIQTAVDTSSNLIASVDEARCD